jgi:hypothetical protein
VRDFGYTKRKRILTVQYGKAAYCAGGSVMPIVPSSRVRLLLVATSFVRERLLCGTSVMSLGIDISTKRNTTSEDHSCIVLVVLLISHPRIAVRRYGLFSLS